MEKKTRGRKTISKTEKTVVITAKVSESQKAKYFMAGGSSRFRAWLDRLKVKGGQE